MESIVYISSGVRPFSQEELEDLLLFARQKNDLVGITGMLLYANGNFVQAIEGEPAALDGLLDRLARDPRHHSLKILLREPITERRFPDWSMGFRYIGPDNTDPLPGYNDLMGESTSGLHALAANPTRAQKLLAAVASRM